MNASSRRPLTRSVIAALGFAACTEFLDRGLAPNAESTDKTSDADGGDASLDDASSDQSAEASEGGPDAQPDQGAPTDVDADASAWSWSPVSTDSVTTSGVVRITFGVRDCENPFVPQLGADAGTDAEAAALPVHHCSGVLITNRWVLTSRSCMCLVAGGASADPTNLRVYSYGTLKNDPAPHCSYGWVIALHDQYDIALIRLQDTLPFEYPPNIYSGLDGQFLTGQASVAWGFGPNRLDDEGVPIGTGESLNKATMRITGTGVLQQQVEAPNPCNVPSLEKPSEGLLAVPLDESPAVPLPGAAGGPLFLGDDPKTRILVGVLKGTSTSLPAEYGYTGIWLIRDWIRQQAPDITPRSGASMVIPGTTADTFGAALAQDSRGSLHIVAVEKDESVRHWRKWAGEPPQELPRLPGVRTSHAVGIGEESTGPPNDRHMAVVYRESGSGKLKYARWSEATGWLSPPLEAGVETTPSAPAMAEVDLIVYVRSNGMLASTRYDADQGGFLFPHLLPDSAPPPDPTRRISAAYEAAFFAAGLFGYQTQDNDWVQFRGTLDTEKCSAYWCPFVSFSTNWQSAALVYPYGQRFMLISSPAPGAGSELQNYVTFNDTLFSWGSNAQPAYGPISAGTLGDDVWVVSESVYALVLQKADNTFANDW